jgi:heme A synthase
MTALRRLSIAALALAFCQIVFGAIVRITGSGWGCGEHWPKCDGHWVPVFAGAQLMVEVSHRYGAVLITALIVALVVQAWRGREAAGVGGHDGVLGAAAVALGITVVTALFGMITIKLKLDPPVIVGHFVLALCLLATLVVAAIRAGGLGAPRATGSATAARTWRVARAAAVLAFIVLVLGALTANLGAAGACLGFPHCRVYSSPNRGLVYLQLTHRIVAFLFALHVLGAVRRLLGRPEAGVVKRAGAVAAGAIVLQIIVAAALVETRLPPVLQSLHQAVGTFVWIAVVVFAVLARRAAEAEPARLDEIAPSPDSTRADLHVARLTPTAIAVIEPTSREPEFKARLADADKAAHAYESAMLALLAQAESHFETVVSYEGDDLDEIPSFEPHVSIVTTTEPAVQMTSPVVEPGVAEPQIENPQPSSPQEEPAPQHDASPCEGDPVSIPDEIVTPGTVETPAPQPKRPHSVAVIIARGADF